jgi:hypothetical protein
MVHLLKTLYATFIIHLFVVIWFQLLLANLFGNIGDLHKVFFKHSLFVMQMLESYCQLLRLH